MDENSSVSHSSQDFEDTINSARQPTLVEMVPYHDFDGWANNRISAVQQFQILFQQRNMADSFPHTEKVSLSIDTYKCDVRVLIRNFSPIQTISCLMMEKSRTALVRLAHNRLLNIVKCCCRSQIILNPNHQIFNILPGSTC